MPETNTDRFTAAYTEALEALVRKHPEDYHYTVEGVPKVVAKMVPAYKAGMANIGPAMKAAARKLGIKPTLSDVRNYLNS